MSRVLKEIAIPTGVEVNHSDTSITVKGTKGQMNFNLHSSLKMTVENNTVRFEPKASVEDGKIYLKALPMTGTTKSLFNNLMTGVTKGFEKKLTFIGVGYRTKVQGNVVNLSLGFSHPINHELPEGITAESPSQTELIIRGMDKQKVGQVAADIRAYRPPEPYKGKGVRYSDEEVVRKEAKKK